MVKRGPQLVQLREGITKATVSGIENLADTVGTGTAMSGENERRLRAALLRSRESRTRCN